MTTEALKSAVITNLNATPPVRATTGTGAAGMLRSVDGTLTATTGKTTGSVYRMVRVPSNAKVKHVFACLDAAVTTFDADIGLYYSDNTQDGTQATLQGTVISAAFFASAVDLHAIITPTDYVFEATTNVAAKRLQPLWQAAGLSSDPGGFFDIALTSTSTTSGAPVVHLEAQYVE